MLAKFWRGVVSSEETFLKCTNVIQYHSSSSPTPTPPHPTILRMSHLPSPFPNSRYWLDITVSHINYCSKMTDTLTKTPLLSPFLAPSWHVAFRYLHIEAITHQHGLPLSQVMLIVPQTEAVQSWLGRCILFTFGWGCLEFLAEQSSHKLLLVPKANSGT